MSTTADVAFDQATLERFADLAIGFAANVQKGQIVAIGAELGKEAMVRALAAKAYQHGAKFVDVQYFDMHVKRARILDADEDTLDYVPPWYGQRLLELGRLRCARIGLVRAGHARAARRPRPRAARDATSCPSSARPASWSTSARRTGRSCPTRPPAGPGRSIPG